MSITFTTVLINVQVIKMFVSRGYGWPSTSDKTVALTFMHRVIREMKKLKFLLMRARAKKEIAQQSRRRTSVQQTNDFFLKTRKLPPVRDIFQHPPNSELQIEVSNFYYRVADSKFYAAIYSTINYN